MESENRFDGIDAYAAKLIRHKARQMARSPGFSASDREDLEQELVLDLLQRLSQYDPKRAGRNTFMARVIEHKVATIIEYRRRSKRDCRREVQSLNATLHDMEGNETRAIDSVDQESYLRRVGVASPTEQERTEARMDLETLLRRLPDDQRRLCDLLRFKGVAEVSQETGIPRPTLYDIINRLKAALRREDSHETR